MVASGPGDAAAIPWELPSARHRLSPLNRGGRICARQTPEPAASTVIPPRRLLLAGAVLLAALTAGACGDGTEMPARAAAPLADQIFSATSLASTTDPIYESPVETTPITRYVVDGAEQDSGVSDLFVIGTVERVAAGYGYSWPGGPPNCWRTDNRGRPPVQPRRRRHFYCAPPRHR